MFSPSYSEPSCALHTLFIISSGSEQLAAVPSTPFGAPSSQVCPGRHGSRDEYIIASVESYCKSVNLDGELCFGIEQRGVMDTACEFSDSD